MESGHGEAAITLIEAGADRERVRSLFRNIFAWMCGLIRSGLLPLQTNSDGQTPEEIDGVGEREQKKVRDYVVSRVGPRIE
jgi:26S proteasome non-ATPase regulatory subunit 10